jgi:CRISPR-associated protein Cas2
VTVLIVENVTTGVRGELSRWLLEPHTGVFVGRVSAMVRDRLWDKTCKACKEGGVIQIWSTNNEQGFVMRVFGNTKRDIVDYEGIQLVLRRK